MPEEFEPLDPPACQSDSRLPRVSASSLDLCELPPAGRLILDLGADPETAAEGISAALGIHIPAEPDTVTVGEPLIAWLRPGRYFVLTAPAQAAPLLTRLQALVRPFGGCCVDVSASQVTFRLHGSAAAECLAGLVTIDLRESALGIGACAQTHLLQARALILRTPDGVGFDVHVDRSRSAYSWSALLQAGGEFGLPGSDVTVSP